MSYGVALYDSRPTAEIFGQKLETYLSSELCQRSHSTNSPKSSLVILLTSLDEREMEIFKTNQVSLPIIINFTGYTIVLHDLQLNLQGKGLCQSDNMMAIYNS